MTHDYPMVLAPTLDAPRAARSAPPPVPPSAIQSLGSWRYRGVPRSRWRLALAILISAGLHGSLLLAVRRHPPVVAHEADDHLIAITIAMPDLKDLEEPEPAPRDDAEKPDLADYAPTLMDAPQIALPKDFVQEINFASLIPQPDLEQAKVFVIPHNIIRSGKLGEGLGNIFNLADLDHVPEPVVQPSPIFPQSMKREVSYARVVVEFIVDTDGRVHSPVVTDTTIVGFEDAAMSGVSRWRFRPGMRSGRRVNTRMSVPIIFRVNADSN